MPIYMKIKHIKPRGIYQVMLCIKIFHSYIKAQATQVVPKYVFLNLIYTVTILVYRTGCGLRE